MNVMIVVTHLLGSGHLVRAMILADAFTRAGHSAVVVSGGVPIRHDLTSRVEIIQLPPLRSDGTNFTKLLDEANRPVSDSYLHRRMQRLTQILTELKPDVLITELYPFGRRVLRSEFQALLSAAKSMAPQVPLICASIRDILATPSKPQKVGQTSLVLDEYYDTVLVHSDETVMPLGASWPTTKELEQKLTYTGFVAPTAAGPHPDHQGKDEILVSAGGGNVGQSIYLTALDAAARDASRRWRMLIGGSDAQTRCAHLAASAPDNVIVEPARPDFRQMLHHAAASVSMCGYNTAIDVLQTGVPAVFVPFDTGGETEQTLRAETLDQLTGIEVLKENTLSADRLLSCLTAAESAPRRDVEGYKLDGAQTTVSSVEAFIKEKGC